VDAGRILRRSGNEIPRRRFRVCRFDTVHFAKDRGLAQQLKQSSFSVVEVCSDVGLLIVLVAGIGHRVLRGAAPGEQCKLGIGQSRTEPHRDRRLIAAELSQNPPP